MVPATLVAKLIASPSPPALMVSPAMPTLVEDRLVRTYPGRCPALMLVVVLAAVETILNVSMPTVPFTVREDEATICNHAVAGRCTCVLEIPTVPTVAALRLRLSPSPPTLIVSPASPIVVKSIARKHIQPPVRRNCGGRAGARRSNINRVAQCRAVDFQRFHAGVPDRGG